jgi:hypothetical protein
MLSDAASALIEADINRREIDLGELQASGVVLVLEGADPAFPLKLDSLERLSTHRLTARRSKWLLLSVSQTDSGPERAVVWVSDEYRSDFLKLFEDYANAQRNTAGGLPKNRELVANIARIRTGVLEDLWQSNDLPQRSHPVWWEVWLRSTVDGIRDLHLYAEVNGLTVAERVMVLGDRTITWIRAAWDELQGLPFTSVPISEMRRPEFVDTVEDLGQDELGELIGDLLSRLTAAEPSAPAVCHLDTGVYRDHVLLVGSLDAGDMHSVTVDSPGDRKGHGTLMAGLALYGSLEPLLLSSAPVKLVHRLESVKILPDFGAPHEPSAYGMVTAEAAAAPEISSSRRRVFCMPITAVPEGRAGEPSLWSASIDALSAGTTIGQSGEGISLIGPPEPEASRLFIISAGNVDPSKFQSSYHDICDLSAVQDPAQSWNALTVGAYTELVQTPSDPSFDGWSPLAQAGALSPHSRTSNLFGSRPWPIKPDICMEGGNVLTNGTDFHEAHSLLTLRTTRIGSAEAIGSAMATSAATAQAARLGALAMAAYPDYWPETIRALMVHSAQWTPTMRREFDGAKSKLAKLALLRRYGWGVPTEQSVLYSSEQAVTMVIEDEFQPFEGPAHAARRFRLHRLPWPEDVLSDLGSATVRLRVTLSYFVEPSASRRGWRQRYAYASHGLRFELMAPTESLADFLARVNREAQMDEDGVSRPSGASDRWLIGSNQRNTGSLHQDVWEGSGADLAACGFLAVHPVGGWWKNNKRKDRVDREVGYSLVVSLATDEQNVDLYTPVATQLSIPIAATVSAI